MLLVEMFGDSDSLHSLLTAGQIKQCYDLNMPCFVSLVQEELGEYPSVTKYVIPIDSIGIDLSGGVPVYSFNTGFNTFTANTLDDPIALSFT